MTVLTRSLVFDPVVAVAAEALEGKAADELEGLGAQAPAASAPTVCAWAAQALDGGPVRVDALDEVAASHGGVGQVVGADPVAHGRSVVLDGLAGGPPRDRP